MELLKKFADAQSAVAANRTPPEKSLGKRPAWKMFRNKLQEIAEEGTFQCVNTAMLQGQFQIHQDLWIYVFQSFLPSPSF